MQINEIFGISLPFFWVILTIALGLIEIFTQGLTTIWFCGGAFVAGLLALAGISFPFQVAAFIIVSITMLIFTRPIAIKKLNKEVIPTNAEALIGKKGLVTEEISEFTFGQVRLKGIEWTAISQDGESIPKGSKVIVNKIEGVKLVVAPLLENMEK